MYTLGLGVGDGEADFCCPLQRRLSALHSVFTILRANLCGLHLWGLFSVPANIYFLQEPEGQGEGGLKLCLLIHFGAFSCLGCLGLGVSYTEG